MDAAAIVSRCVDPVTGALGTLQSGEIDMLGRGDYLIQSEALADQDSWHGAVPEADWAGVEQNPDHALSLTLDTSAARRSSIGRERRPFQAASGPRYSERQLIS